MENILNLYNNFANDKPIMLYDIQEMLIYAYPYNDYINSLNEKSRKMTIEQYEDAIKNSQIVIFIRDNQERKLMSFTFDL